jgi:hypothetical protein
MIILHPNDYAVIFFPALLNALTIGLIQSILLAAGEEIGWRRAMPTGPYFS